MPTIRQPPPGQTHVHGVILNQKATNNCLPPSISQSTPVSISSISPESSSDLDTGHGDTIDETIKHVKHTINQTLLTSSITNATANKASNGLHDNMPDLQPTQDISPHSIHMQTNAKSTSIKQTHSIIDNIKPPVTTFKKTKNIIMNIDALSYSTTLHNKIKQSINLNGLCKYDTLHKAYLFEYSNKPVNCFYILVFLKQSACYTITLDTHQCYRINTNEITDNHNIVLCNDPTLNMVPLSTAELSESNTFEAIARLIPSENQRDLPNSNQTQATLNTLILTNNNICNTSQNSMAQSHDQCTIILQIFSMITQELKLIKNFTN